ncbi:MAG: PilZ domain-containing protein [Candidatus Brocadiae bacterium]|nr:PilZ domain-containing protein [Candidatus Brocadiia bacterium]
MPESTRERPLVRLRQPAEVRYKFLSKTRQDPEQNEIYEGTAPSLSSVGCLLDGKIPRIDWLADLLMQKMVLGVNLLLPPDPEPLKVLGEVHWIERIDEETGRCRIRLSFREITQADRNRIFTFQVKAQLPGG